MLNNYKKFREGMILRDYLALDRTILANERTLLAYLRTFIGLLSAGIGLVKLLDSFSTLVMGYIFIAVSPFFLVFGIMKYIKVTKKLKTIDDSMDSEKDVVTEAREDKI